MEIYVADVRPLAQSGVFEEKMQRLPSARREHILKCKREADRLRGLGAGLLLEYGLRQRGYSLVKGEEQGQTDLSAEGMLPVTLEKGRFGKTYLCGCSGLFFNLSHAGDYVAAVFAEDEVGIDIESIRRAKEGVARRFFLGEECEYLGLGAEASLQWSKEEQDLRFTRLWTRKESYIKAIGEGMHLPLNSFSVLGDEVVTGGENGERWYLRTYDKPEGYVLSVCGRATGEVKWQELRKGWLNHV